MKKTLAALAVLVAAGLSIGAATTASAAPMSQAGSGIVQPGSSIQLAGGGHHHGGHHHGWHRRGFFGGGIFLAPLTLGSCYENCRAYRGPRYCRAKCYY